MLPIIKSAFPFLADCILAASSGKLVPSATSVSPITYEVTPKNSAISVAPVIKRFEPYIKRTSEEVEYRNKTMALYFWYSHFYFLLCWV